MLPDDAEEVDVGIVDREIYEDNSGASVYPQVLLEVGDGGGGVERVVAQVCVEAGSGVGGDFTLV